jgi:hypothetical protein
LGEAELLLDHPERVLDLGPDADLHLFSTRSAMNSGSINGLSNLRLRGRIVACQVGYLLGSYRIASAPELNSIRLTSFKSTCFGSPADKVGRRPRRGVNRSRAGEHQVEALPETFHHHSASTLSQNALGIPRARYSGGDAGRIAAVGEAVADNRLAESHGEADFKDGS